MIIVVFPSIYENFLWFEEIISRTIMQFQRTLTLSVKFMPFPIFARILA